MAMSLKLLLTYFSLNSLVLGIESCEDFDGIASPVNRWIPYVVLQCAKAYAWHWKVKGPFEMHAHRKESCTELRSMGWRGCAARENVERAFVIPSLW